ncbi:MAG: hypothetical protein ACTSVB_07840 [Candidatus Heimdallarchaeaceae archaeon]
MNKIDDLKQEYIKFFSGQYFSARDEILDITPKNVSLNTIKVTLNISKDIVAEKSGIYIVESYYNGINKVGMNDNIPIESDLRILHNYHSDSIIKFFLDILSRIESVDKTEENIINIFESQYYRIEFIADWYIKKAYWLGVASALSVNHDKIEIEKVNDDKNDYCYNFPDKINTKFLSFEIIPIYHPGCRCKIKI